MKTADFHAYHPKLASYACHPDTTRGRLHDEQESLTRTAFQRDRDRIIHSTAFRRLEYKTQVFVNHEGDHYRTRLTHSLEVSQLARSMCRALGVNEDLGEALALAHDLGHTAFGHAGEDALAEVMQPYNGFEHNAQTIRILTKLENRYAEFDGLNLSWETLEGIAKHNGPVKKKARALDEYNALHNLELETHASIEAQVASLADDIAYNNHDMDDGLRAGLFELEALFDIPLVGNVFKEMHEKHQSKGQTAVVHESVRRIIHAMVVDLLTQTGNNISQEGVETVDDVRSLGKAMVGFSKEREQSNKALKTFLYEHMYRHYKVNRMMTKAKHVLQRLFEYFMEYPESLPPQWQKHITDKSDQARAIVVCDFVAGMTDRFAIKEYQRLFDVTTELVSE